MININNERPIRFTGNVGAGETLKREFTLKHGGQITRFYTKFYGSMLEFEVIPQIEKLGTEIAVPLFQYADGDTGALAGDFEEIKENVLIPVNRGDKLIVTAINKSEKIHSLNCVMTVKELM